jgi:phosphatidate cytidylyltransferase
MVPLGLGALWYGGLVWVGLLALLCAAASGEWTAMAQRLSGQRWPLPLILFGMFYIWPTFAALVWLRGDGQAGRAQVLVLLLVVWASDIGAYLAGRLLGGPRLAPRISPGKTWSGAAGGLAAAMLVGFGAAAFWDAPPWPDVAIAGALGLVSQAGDLFESAAKRHFGVKDSGRLIPGHGGVLDRVDGLLTAAPTAALMVWALGQGKVMWQ